MKHCHEGKEGCPGAYPVNLANTLKRCMRASVIRTRSLWRRQPASQPMLAQQAATTLLPPSSSRLLSQPPAACSSKVAAPLTRRRCPTRGRPAAVAALRPAARQQGWAAWVDWVALEGWVQWTRHRWSR